MAGDKKYIRASRVIRERARELRKPLTPAEKILWDNLRGRKCQGLKFRRQHPIGRFIVDFYCAEIRLIIELDGGIHLGREAYDEERTKILEREGYHVMRFANEAVIQQLDTVLNCILHFAESITE